MQQTNAWLKIYPTNVTVKSGDACQASSSREMGSKDKRIAGDVRSCGFDARTCGRVVAWSCGRVVVLLRLWENKTLVRPVSHLPVGGPRCGRAWRSLAKRFEESGLVCFQGLPQMMNLARRIRLLFVFSYMGLPASGSVENKVVAKNNVSVALCRINPL